MTTVTYPFLSRSISDSARLWAVTLIDPQVPLGRRVRDEHSMLTSFTQAPEWAAVFSAGVLSSLVRSLPDDDPWRHLSARIASSARRRDLVRDEVHAPPAATGAVLPDGRSFGGFDNAAWSGFDPELDIDDAALVDGLSGPAAALFAFATDGWLATVGALRALQEQAAGESAWAFGTRNSESVTAHAAASVWATVDSAVRWAMYRRRQMLESLTAEARSERRDEFARDLVWSWASLADEVLANTKV